MNRRVAARGIIVHNGRLLCAQLKAYDDKPAQDFWSTPGGGVNPGEALIPALEREIIEETGIKPKVGRLLYIQQFVWHANEQMEFFFYIENASDYLNIDITQTSHGAAEIDRIEFVDPKAVTVLPKFLKDEDMNTVAAQTQPKIFNYL